MKTQRKRLGFVHIKTENTEVDSYKAAVGGVSEEDIHWDGKVIREKIPTSSKPNEISSYYTLLKAMLVQSCQYV